MSPSLPSRSPFSSSAVRAAATQPVPTPLTELRSYLFFLGLIATTFLV